MHERLSEDRRSDAGANPERVDRAFAEVYEELRRIAQSHIHGQPPGHTLQTTALVHEAFLKLRGSRISEDRGHFLHLAAEAMRQVLVDHARAKKCEKRGGRNVRREELADVAVLAVHPDADTILALEEAISRLETVSPRAAEVIKLRFFTGLSIEETAEATGLSESTVNRHWRFARAWLFDALEGNDGNGKEDTGHEPTARTPPRNEPSGDQGGSANIVDP